MGNPAGPANAGNADPFVRRVALLQRPYNSLTIR